MRPRSPRCRPFTTRWWTRRWRSPVPEEAELAKLLENTFRQVNIALVNETGHVCSRNSGSTYGKRSTRRRPNRSASCASPPVPAWAGIACPSTRATCPGRYAGQLGAIVSVRRARQRHQRAHARLRSASARRGAEPAGASDSGAADPASAWRTRGTSGISANRPLIEVAGAHCQARRGGLAVDPFADPFRCRRVLASDGVDQPELLAGVTQW